MNLVQTLLADIAGFNRSSATMATRRTFLEVTAASIFTAGLGSQAFGTETKNGIPYRSLGRTGEKVSMVGIGGYHLGKPDQTAEESIRIIRTALSEGINFLDNCWDYNGGESEIRMGRALRDGYRQKAFLMTKIDGRNKAAATAQLNESLRRLQKDRWRTCGKPKRRARSVLSASPATRVQTFM